MPRLPVVHVEESAVFSGEGKHGHITERCAGVIGWIIRQAKLYFSHLRSTRPAAVYVAVTAPYRGNDSTLTRLQLGNSRPRRRKKMFVGGKEERRRRVRGVHKRSRRRSNTEHVGRRKQRAPSL